MSQDIPLPEGFKGLSVFPRLRENLINCFNPDEKIISLPGLQLFTLGFGKARGQALFKDKAYMVSGTRFSRINENATIDNLGAIVGTEKVVLAPSFVQMAIVNAQTGDGFVWDETTLTPITDVSYAPAIDVDVIDGRAVFCPLDGSPVFYSLANDFLTIDGFVDAEALPDKNVGVINYRGDLYVLGENSIELLRSSGDADNPFIRDSGAAIQTGYVAGKVKYSETFAFLGRVTDNSYSFHVMDNGYAPQISTPEIEELINQYSLDELKTCVGQTYKHKGYQVLQFTIEAIDPESVSRTFCYVDGRWFFAESGIGGALIQNAWRGRYITFAYGRYIVGDLLGGNIGTFYDDNLEYGQNIEREITTFIRINKGSYFTIPSITVNCLVGVAEREATIGMQLSKDGIVYMDEMWRDLGREGDYQRTVQFRCPGGLGTYENFCGIRLRVTQNVEFSAYALQMNL